MNDDERELFRDRRLRSHQRRLRVQEASCKECGLTDLGCLICVEIDPRALEGDHPAGRAHHDAVVYLCRNCHAKRSDFQREEPRGGPDPRNPLEVIGRWLLGMAQYFELLMVTLRRFGEFLIGLARQGYGSDLSFPERL
jgi:hypothetical protein